MWRRTLICIFTAVPCLAALPVAAAAPAPTRILVPNMLEGSIRELEPLLRARIASPLAFEYIQMVKLPVRLSEGEPVDVAMMGQAVIAPLAARGQIKSQTELVRSSLGLAVADGVKPPVLKTDEDFVAFLKATPSIALFGTGASGAAVMKFAEQHGLTEMLKRKATFVSDGFAGTLVREGKTASAVQQFSELKFAGVNNIVELPESMQTRGVSSIVVFNSSQHQDVAAQLTRLLTSPEAAAVYRSAGLAVAFKP